MGTWKSKNRHKYLLQYHIIFVCKYRKKLLMSKQISDDIKQFSYKICQKHKVIIRYMETDKDHIHYMIETEPTMSISKIVNLMKSYTIYHIWKRYPNYLRKHFWKEHTFWTDGYFACSVGNFKSKHDNHKSYTTNYTNGNITVNHEKGKIKLPKLKEVKARLHRNYSGQIKTATVSQMPSGKYYVSILVETEHKELVHTTGSNYSSFWLIKWQILLLADHLAS